ncbi:hypothetical protein IE53DRAFT_385696 [Violaceomyces palustris]|uniref:Uncharacterized protein n=1 Tax=Violaceomyces palustris TaxID=1673888 RepID=A0ACD0P1K2_9BASI|nr:hypothetical protein IE53DRAFT_385696 [Violaceomyces palustris]
MMMPNYSSNEPRSRSRSAFDPSSPDLNVARLGGQSFLSLDDMGASPNPSQDAFASSSKATLQDGTGATGSSTGASEHSDNGFDSPTETGLTRSRSIKSPRSPSAGRSPGPPISPPTAPRANRERILEGTKRYQSSDLAGDWEARSGGFPGDDSTEEARPRYTRGSRLGAQMGKSQATASSLPSSNVANSSQGYSRPAGEEGGSSVVDAPDVGPSRGWQVRNKESRSKLMGMEPPSRAEGQRLAPAFGLGIDGQNSQLGKPSPYPGQSGDVSQRIHRSHGEDYLEEPGRMASQRYGPNSSPSPSEVEFSDQGDGNVPRRILGRPSSHSNLLATGAAGGPPHARGGRLGRLQYSKTDGISLPGNPVAHQALSAKASASNMAGNYRQQGDLPGPAAHSLSTRESTRYRAPSPTRGHPAWGEDAAHSPGSSLTGLGIGVVAGSSGRVEASSATTGQKELILPSVSANHQQQSQSDSASRSRNGTQSAADTLANARNGLQGIASSPDTSHGWGNHSIDSASTSVSGASKAASSRSSLQESYHNRFSRQRPSDPSRSSSGGNGKSQANEGGLGGRSHLDMSPSSDSGLGSPTIAQHRQVANMQRSSNGAGGGSSLGSPLIDPGSPTVGGLSDEAIAALGATPGTGPDELLNPNGAPLSSKNVLTIALSKAQSAVQLDSANNVPEAIAAYRQAVRLLQEVMERIAPKSGKKTRPSREEERRRLKVIHDTYADRIRLLSMIYSPEDLMGVSDSSAMFGDTSTSSFGTSSRLSEADEEESWQAEHRGIPASSTPTFENGTMATPKNRNDQDGSSSFFPEMFTPSRSDFSSSEGPEAIGSAMMATGPKFSPPSPEYEHPPGMVASWANTETRRESAAPTNRKPARERKGSRSSVALSLADELVDRDITTNDPGGSATNDAGPMPAISIHPETPSFIQAPADGQEVLRDKERFSRERTGSAHDRSDSDSSFRSTQTSGRFGTGLSARHKSFGLDEEIKSPTTIFFDADPSLPSEDYSTSESAGRPSARGHHTSNSIRDSEMAEAWKSQKSQEGGPHDRSGSIGESPMVPRVSALSREGNPSRRPRRRPNTAESSQNSTDSSLTTVPPSEWSPGQDGSRSRLVGRPRAATTASPSGAETSATFLVSPTTTAGTISQRRKNLAAGVASGSGRGSLESQPHSFPSHGQNEKDLVSVPVSADMLRAKSADHADSTVRASSGRAEVSSPTQESGIGSSRSSVSSTTGRQRATSQPSHRRPSIPASFVHVNAASQAAPPLPKLARKTSMPPTPGSAASSIALGAGDLPSSSASSLSPTSQEPQPPKRLSSVSGIQQQAGESFSAQRTLAEADFVTETTKPVSLADIFPSGLPSLASGTPSYASNSSGALFPWLGLGASLPDPATLPLLPAQPVLRPFHLMRQLLVSIRSGGYITHRLFVPKGLWLQQGARLVAIESKVRMLELVSNGIEGVEKGGEGLLATLSLSGSSRKGSLGLETTTASKFVKQLDEFDLLLVEVQNNLAKKLGFLETVTGKKASNSFGALGSKLTRSLDRMTNGGKNLDTPAVYVEGLARLFSRAQVLERHLEALIRSQDPISQQQQHHNHHVQEERRGNDRNSDFVDGYSTLAPDLKRNIEARLKRSSDFFANVVLAFVLRDLGVLVDKFVKRGGTVFSD